MKKSATIQAIADQLKVNKSTVSRVLNGFPNISEETRARVLRAADRLEYQPNHIAKGLNGKGTRVISLITPALNPHVLPVIRGVSDACRAMGHALMLFPTDYWTPEAIAFSDIRKRWLVDGILVYNVIHHPDIEENIRRLRSEHIPFVFINKLLGARKANTVSVDNRDAVLQLTRRLHSLGRRRIGIMNGSLASNDGVERFEAFKDALGQLGLKWDERLVGKGEFGEQLAHDEMKRILKSGRRPDAMFCASDLMAIGSIKAIRDAGLSVPGDIAVAGFDDIALGRYLKPRLTTIRPPLEDVGRMAVELLRKVIDDPKRPIEEISLPGKIIVRESS